MDENNTANKQGAEKTFTQDEVNGIVAQRLAKEQEKYADYETLKDKAQKFDEAEEAQKSELQKVTEARDALQAELDGMKKADSIRTIRETVANEKGVPASLLTAETEDECKAQADAILSFAKKPDYPIVSDGGEVISTGKKTTRDQFADWMNKQF